MNCRQIDERLLAMTAAETVPSFSAGELDHVATCARCRERSTETTAAFARIGRAAAERQPDPSYWPSVLPRIRERAGTGESRLAWLIRPAFARAFVPAAAVAVLALLFSVVTTGPPAKVAGGAMLSTLSDRRVVRVAAVRRGRRPPRTRGVERGGGVVGRGIHRRSSLRRWRTVHCRHGRPGRPSPRRGRRAIH